MVNFELYFYQYFLRFVAGLFFGKLAQVVFNPPEIVVSFIVIITVVCAGFMVDRMVKKYE